LKIVFSYCGHSGGSLNFWRC